MSSNEDVKKKLYGKLDEVIKRAKLSGSLIRLELDANSKLGPDINPGDDWVVFNSLDLCKGKITRYRKQ